jgi:asparagine synthase (glutamine-hydrolysing)
MCGIGGVIHRNGRPVDRARLTALSAAMWERGPDDHDELYQPGVGLVHRRLSVIDLTTAGRCPMPNEDASVQVLFNGEIYNHQSLRAELVARGHSFRSACDTEVIVHGYEEWGDDLVHRIEGMFAIAVWDDERKRLFLCRDRTGEKPLFYASNAESLVFASTLAALRQYLRDDAPINLSALKCYLSHSFVPGPHTIWDGVSALPPAFRATYNVQTGALELDRYWDFPVSRLKQIDVMRAENAVEASLEDSIAARLVADVPVGAFLSGGVDSSLLVSLATRHCDRLNTFAVGFAGDQDSELPYARRVAQLCGTKHHELVVDDDSLLEVLPELVWQYGQPFGDPSAIPSYLLSRFARQHVTVALSGDGADESFAGYWRAESAWYAARYARIVPQAFREHGVPALASALGAIGLSHIGRRASALNTLSLDPNGAGYTNSDSWFNTLPELLSDDVWSQVASHDSVKCRTGRVRDGGTSTVLQQVLYDDFQVLLPAEYLTKMDVASMTASLEVRSPYLATDFLELVWRLPDAVKLRHGQRKWLLKRVAARHLPRDIIYRRKQGFAPPLARWWRGPLARVLTHLMRDSRAVNMGLIRALPIQIALHEHQTGVRDHSTRLWLILWLELWLRIVNDGTMSRSDSLTAVA